ncbi:hypothetical protein EVAR_80307_1 [Eumeta japonica]|uniref:Uncharacterized protein n=1 Tax=Eumeta variegata TaxID=151549 RepID=A0A4C1UC27_EUMVA|nr:hypothetical protein EVAR_80307_1 [Eumeta japonica]
MRVQRASVSYPSSDFVIEIRNSPGPKAWRSFRGAKPAAELTQWKPTILIEEAISTHHYVRRRDINQSPDGQRKYFDYALKLGGSWAAHAVANPASATRRAGWTEKVTRFLPTDAVALRAGCFEFNKAFSHGSHVSRNKRIKACSVADDFEKRIKLHKSHRP